jgi:glycosyltransferase involved in cell wall biosynthesis
VGLSVVIITRDEERNIARCLGSLRGIADEVILVDSGSTDRTRAIAQEHGAQVVERAWKGYSDQKNFANGLASHPFILSLDADEALSDELRADIARRKKVGFRGAYRLKRLTNYCGSWVRYGGWYPDAKVRLFPKEGVEWRGDHVHEELVLPAGVGITELQGDLLHFSYHSVQDHRDRIERYSTLHARAMHENGKRAPALEAHARTRLQVRPRLWAAVGLPRWRRRLAHRHPQRARRAPQVRQAPPSPTGPCDRLSTSSSAARTASAT